MRFSIRTLVCILAVLIIGLIVAADRTSQARVRGVAVAFPWVFTNGNATSQKTAMDTADAILSKAGYAPVPRDVARRAWAALKQPAPARNLPTKTQLQQFGKKAGAAVVLYGSVNWHTRSIWVGTGPKTISTATVSTYVMDVKSGARIYTKTGVKGRSDEKENTLKVIADVLITPLVTVVSGGPKTPQEQRAAQIAMARALHDWVKR